MNEKIREINFKNHFFVLYTQQLTIIIKINDNYDNQ